MVILLHCVNDYFVRCTKKILRLDIHAGATLPKISNIMIIK